MKQAISRYFRLEENGSDFKTEMIAGITTFMTMAYIIFVNPAILSHAMGKGNFIAISAATCIASALATLMMGVFARYPVALAPGMGLNAFFAFSICIKMGVPWQTALGIVFLSGLFFTLLTLVKIRQMIIDAIPPSLKIATAVGIGIFIAFIGLKEAGIVASDSNTFVTLGKIGRTPTLLALFGLVVTAALMARRVKGAILWGILVTGFAAWGVGAIEYRKLFALPSISGVFAQLDIMDALQLKYLAPILVLLFFDMFDTIGTLIGVCEQGGLMKDGKLERATPALLSDSIGTMIGAVCGTSTVTSYIESSAGVSEGGKTGLTSVFTALLFLIALFFAPMVQMLGGGCQIEEYYHNVDSKYEQSLAQQKVPPKLQEILAIKGTFLAPSAKVETVQPGSKWVIQDDNNRLTVVKPKKSPGDKDGQPQLMIYITKYLHPITAPALIIVGFLMLSSIRRIDWEDYTEAIPAFLTIIIMPFTFSIAHGLALGFVSYPLLKILSGRGKEVSWLVYLLAALFVIGYYFLPGLVH